MIENVMREIHYSVSINKSAKQQSLEVIKKLTEIMPIERAKMLIKITMSIELKTHLLNQFNSIEYIKHVFFQLFYFYFHLE